MGFLLDRQIQPAKYVVSDPIISQCRTTFRDLQKKITSNVLFHGYLESMQC